MHVYLKKENARRDAEMQAKGLTLESYTEEMRFSEREKGDNASVRCPPYVPYPIVALMLFLASSSATRHKRTAIYGIHFLSFSTEYPCCVHYLLSIPSECHIVDTFLSIDENSSCFIKKSSEVKKYMLCRWLVSLPARIMGGPDE